MRSLLLAAVLGVGSLGLVGATPAKSEASWLSQALHARYDPYYYSGYYQPQYVDPGYSYYAPGYVYPNYSSYYVYPSYNSYYQPYPYYGPAVSLYWGGGRGHYGYWGGRHDVWYGGHRGGHRHR